MNVPWNEQRPRLGHHLLLPAIFLLATALRFWSLNFGLPEVRARPDEQLIVSAALSFFQGDFNPNFFNYPSFYLYLLHVVFRLYAWGGVVSGHFDSMAAVPVAAQADPANFYLLNRGLSALFGVATVYLVYRLGRRLFGGQGERVGLWAALFLAATYLHVRESHFGTTDVAATCFLTAAAAAVVTAYQQGRPRDFAVAGVWAGLATGTKYIGILAAAPVALALILSTLETHPSPRERLRSAARLVVDRRPWCFLLFLLLAFLATNPYVVLERDRFVEDLAYEARHLEEGHIKLKVPAWRAHLLHTLPHGVGLPMLTLAVVGLFLGFRRGEPPRRRTLWVLYLLPLLYLAVALRGQTAFVRYMVPVAPFIALAAAQSCANLQQTRWAQTRRLRWVPAALVVAVLLPSLVNSIRVNQLLGKRDSRVLAREWIVENVPPGSSIAQTGRLIPTVDLPRTYDPWKVNIRTGRFEGKERRELPQFLVVEDSALHWYNRPIRRISKLPERFYGAVWEITAADLSPEVVERNVYDHQDLFYLPFAGFHGVERPGPNITIYQLGYPSP